eukprot:11214358-Lingulodinium_polyedra.AAC.1
MHITQPDSITRGSPCGQPDSRRRFLSTRAVREQKSSGSVWAGARGCCQNRAFLPCQDCARADAV